MYAIMFLLFKKVFYKNYFQIWNIIGPIFNQGITIIHNNSTIFSYSSWKSVLIFNPLFVPWGNKMK